MVWGQDLVSIRDDFIYNCLKFGKERKLFVFDQRQIELKNCEKNVILINKNLIVINRNTETDSLLDAFFWDKVIEILNRQNRERPQRLGEKMYRYRKGRFGKKVLRGGLHMGSKDTFQFHGDGVLKMCCFDARFRFFADVDVTSKIRQVGNAVPFTRKVFRGENLLE